MTTEELLAGYFAMDEECDLSRGELNDLLLELEEEEEAE